jgi:hypothetical protein
VDVGVLLIGILFHLKLAPHPHKNSPLRCQPEGAWFERVCGSSPGQTRSSSMLRMLPHPAFRCAKCSDKFEPSDNKKSPSAKRYLGIFTPSDKHYTNKRIHLIEDLLQLPEILKVKSKSFLIKLYSKDNLSVREIAGLTNTSHSTILSALLKLGIPLNGNGHKRKGQIPFGFEYKEYRLVKRKEEQEIIRMIRQYRVNGLSLRKIADELNQKLVPTKNCGIWQATTVRKILERN